MAYEAEQDPLCYPSTSVLINKAELRNQQDLDEFEFSMFVTRAEEPLPAGNMGYGHYAIHHHLFQDVYDWAGQPRTVRIAKGSNWFCYPENLDSFMAATFAWLDNRDHLTRYDSVDFARNAARFLGELNAGHPFREGNGRTQLAFLKVLVLNSDHPFDDDVLEPKRTLAAMIASFDGNLDPLEALITEIIA